MSKPIIISTDPVTLVGGGDVKSQDLAEALTIAPRLIAVDGGLVAAQAAGAAVEAVIGDLDSAPPEALAQLAKERQHRISEQQSTDFDKALRHVEAPLVIGIGFGGKRIDHQLAAFHTLLVRAERPCILVGEEEVIVMAPPSLSLDMEAGEVVSLYPIMRTTGRSTGLKWPIDGLVFGPMQTIGTSNMATGKISIEIDEAGMLLFLPRKYLRPLVAQFLQGGARWPVRER
ncbi:thiamine diphosphokinase [Sulfitobacter donghicola]|uniref:Thiamine diphosphokinase n=1 Tax=Sulfitobacter donghicola DSW-25 = KCTC 12864 = JCM 14565 TaxID=1300350 RepID=A0A073II38_9RHOB|nr:thiamine diphosphokinase [Sulfitobacter donghicola]KEJ89998.1 thiamine pyrophosphokinase [Sulfitobacter donghicola DSW-25 = KCTC 12864 = JCM 14565]